jgi:hypothetical protein
METTATQRKEVREYSTDQCEGAVTKTNPTNSRLRKYYPEPKSIVKFFLCSFQDQFCISHLDSFGASSGLSTLEFPKDFTISK